MKLNISDWESFCASDIFFLYNGSGITKEEIEDNPGSFPAVQSGADNNGCIGYISKDYCKAMNYTYPLLSNSCGTHSWRRWYSKERVP